MSYAQTTGDYRPRAGSKRNQRAGFLFAKLSTSSKEQAIAAQTAAVLTGLAEAVSALESNARSAFDCGKTPMSDEDFATAWNYEEPGPYARYVYLLTLSKAATPSAKTAPRFDSVVCSNCGESFGPGDSGFLHCKHHKGMKVCADWMTQ